jgi:hypothetical protein
LDDLSKRLRSGMVNIQYQSTCPLLFLNLSLGGAP